MVTITSTVNQGGFSMENLDIKRFEVDDVKVKYAELTVKDFNGTGDVSSMVMATSWLESGEIDFVVVNGTILKRDLFLFKSSKRFNHTKAVNTIFYFFYEPIFDDEESYLLCMSPADLKESIRLMEELTKKE
jgi:pyridoxal/pyridoxine/pyridoxamine kinase